MQPNNNPPDKPGGNGGTPGGSGSNSTPSYTGATTLNTDQTLDNVSYTSNTGAENALLVSGGTITLNAPDVAKTGGASGDEADFYGTNAAILAYNGATLNIIGGAVATDGGHANAVFAYGSGTTINIENTTITTAADTSGGVMVTGGGTLNAKGLTVKTAGNSSAAIRSDRGGGTMNIDGGSYETAGVGSPAIYSTADIAVNGATLVSTTSEGVVIEGKNSVALENVTLTATNHVNNGHSETFKTIFIYQSMSGDASEGVGHFSAKKSLIATNSGDHFFITNTSAVIDLEANDFIQSDANGGFLRAQAGYWGNSGANGGKVTLNATSQNIFGDITIDAISSLELNLTHSYVSSAFLGEGAKNVTVSADSVIVLTADSYISTLNNELSDNSNIYANGHKLFVNGAEVAINQAVAPASFLDTTETVVETAIAASDGAISPVNNLPVWGYFAIVLAGLVVLAVILTVVFKKKPSGGGK